MSSPQTNRELPALRPLPEDDGGPRGSGLLRILGFTLLIAGVCFVLIVLPRLSAEPPEVVEEEAAPEAAAESLEAGAESVPAPGATEAREARKAALELRARLEGERVELWGEETLETSYPEALAQFQSAKEALQAGQFDQAFEDYQDCSRSLQTLDASRPKRLERALQEGGKDLIALDAESAARHFEVAIAIDSTSEAARLGAARAESLPRVARLVAEGRAHETEGRLVPAKDAYAEALALDGQFEPARELLQRVQSEILERDYRRAMSELLVALDGKDPERAHAELDRVLKLKPEAQAEIADLQARLATMERGLELERLGVEAMALERAEDWEGVHDVYQRALAVDSKASFALAGAKRAVAAQELHSVLDEYIAAPSSLGDSEHLRYAGELAEAALVQSKGAPKLRGKADRLMGLVNQYAQDVVVHFQSDGQTKVRIFRVGGLGVFDERTAALKPGTYKVKGERAGYRDVLRTFKVRPGGQETEVVTISCKERL
ncbi:MAG: tetratricopeptide (TPR) repeat protein [Planctomycetota bacterium]|jgi:tetratricopeptide (TPR) repeat protein